MSEADKQRESFFPPNTLRAGIPWFISFTAGNVVSTAVSIGDFSYESAPARAAITTGLFVAIGKIVTRS